MSKPMLVTLGVMFLVFLLSAAPLFVIMLLLDRIGARATSQPRNIGRRIFPRSWAFLLVFPIGLVLESLAKFSERNGTPAEIWAPELLTLLSLALVVTIHELGHLVAAKLVGFRILLFQVWPYVVRRDTHGWKIGFEMTDGSPMGMIKCVPVSMNNLRFNLLFIFAGGPAASLLFALISLLCLLSADGSRSGSFIYSFGLFSGLSFLFFVTNLWPMQVGWFHTDGLLLLTLLRRGADADVIYAQYRWACVAYSEVRPCDWDVSWVSATSTHGQPAPFELLGSMVAYAHAIDSGNIADAGAYLDRAGVAVKQVPIQLTITFFLESAYFEARHRGNAVQARQSFDQAPDLAHAIERYTMLRCESAVLLVEGRGDDAARLIAEARTILDSAAVNGDVLAERDLVLDLERQIKNGLATSATTV